MHKWNHGPLCLGGEWAHVEQPPESGRLRTWHATRSRIYSTIHQAEDELSLLSFDWQYADQKGVDHFVLAAFVVE